MYVWWCICTCVCMCACMYVYMYILSTSKGICQMCVCNISPSAVSCPRESTVCRMISKESSFNSRRADPVAISLRGCPFVKISLISYAFSALHVVCSHCLCMREFLSLALPLAFALARAIDRARSLPSSSLPLSLRCAGNQCVRLCMIVSLCEHESNIKKICEIKNYYYFRLYISASANF